MTSFGAHPLQDTDDESGKRNNADDESGNGSDEDENLESEKGSDENESADNFVNNNNDVVKVDDSSSSDEESSDHGRTCREGARGNEMSSVSRGKKHGCNCAFGFHPGAFDENSDDTNDDQNDCKSAGKHNVFCLQCFH